MPANSEPLPMAAVARRTRSVTVGRLTGAPRHPERRRRAARGARGSPRCPGAPRRESNPSCRSPFVIPFYSKKPRCISATGHPVSLSEIAGVDHLSTIDEATVPDPVNLRPRLGVVVVHHADALLPVLHDPSGVPVGVESAVDARDRTVCAAQATGVGDERLDRLATRPDDRLVSDLHAVRVAD